MDSAQTLAESMLRQKGYFTPIEKRWNRAVRKHRREFTQVREIELFEASIRLPKGRFFVSVTEQDKFDQIEETIPACVQTRLEEFLEGPGRLRNAKVSYLKPLCVEVDDELILTSRADLLKTIDEIREQVFSEYRRMSRYRRPLQAISTVGDAALAVPRELLSLFHKRRQRAIEAYRARLEFKRRRTALGAARLHRKCRTNGCSFDQMLKLTNPLNNAHVAEQYGIEKKLSNAKRDQLVKMAAGSSPWFVTLSLAAQFLSTLTWTATPAVALCDPAFVAEFPDRPGVLYKIGHFDLVGGVMHVEI